MANMDDELWIPEGGPAREGLTDAQLQTQLGKRERSFASYLRWLNRRIREARLVLDSTEENQAGTTLLRLLRDAHLKLNDALNKTVLAVAACQYYDAQVEDIITAYEDQKDAQILLANPANLSLMNEIGRMETDLLPPPPPQQQPGAAGPRPVKIATDLRPKAVLSREASPVELRMWATRFQAYYNASAMQNLALNVQHEYLFSNIDDYLIERLSDKIEPNTPVLQDLGDPMPACMTLIEQEFLKFHPLTTRRLDFFRSTVAVGQSVSQWTSALKRKGDEAALPLLTPDHIYCMRYLVAIPDPMLAELLKIAEPTRDLYDAAITVFEQGQTYRETARGEKALSNAAFGARPKAKTQLPQLQQQQQQVGQAVPTPPQKGTPGPVKGSKNQTPARPVSALAQKLADMRKNNICTDRKSVV